MKRKQRNTTAAALILASFAATANPAHAASRNSKLLAARGQQQGSSSGEDADVSKVKERYWQRGDENEVGVVQNRAYTKSGRLEIEALGGFMNGDPFLSTKLVGATVGYHLSEIYSVHLLGWKDFTSNSSALDTLANYTPHVGANTNEPRGFLGAEFRGSFLYGKLSLLGKAIIHYDLHVSAGGGLTYTETGNDLTGIIGIGQQMFLSNSFSLNVDFRFMPYHEQIPDKVGLNPTGAPLDSRMNWSNTITLGVSWFI